MDKEDVLHVHNGILFSYKKEWNNASCSNMDGPRDYHAKWSKPDKDKYHMITYMWNLKYDTHELIYKTETGSFSSVQSLSRVRLFATLWTAAHQAFLSITNSWSLPKVMSIESVMPSNHLILCRPSCPQFFPVSESFQMSQSIGVSASTSVLPMKTQDWSPLGWTGWISLQSKGLSRVFSNTTIQKHQFFCTQLYL